MSGGRTALALVGLLLFIQSAGAQVLRQDIPEAQGIGVVDRIGDAVPQDLVFTGANGNPVELATFFDGERPVLMVPVYFDCPVLCPTTLQRVLKSLNGMSWTAGDDYRVVCYSFDHTEGYRVAQAKQEATLASYAKEWTDAQQTWAFLTTSDAKVSQALSTALGFHYRFVPKAGEYSHVAAVFFLTPDGVVHNSIEGLDFSGDDIQQGLKEARDGEERSIFDAAYLWCFPYNDETGSNTPAMWRLMTVGATAGAILLFGVIGALIITTGRRAEHDRAQRIHAPDASREAGS